MKTPSKYYIEVTSATYTGDNLADYLENGPLYRDDDGTASDVTHEIAALRAEVDRLRSAATYARTVLTRLADSAHQWAGRDVPVGLVAEVDSAKARLAGVLNV